jgi:hypothetical protein
VLGWLDRLDHGPYLGRPCPHDQRVFAAIGAIDFALERTQFKFAPRMQVDCRFGPILNLGRRIQPNLPLSIKCHVQDAGLLIAR